ncbi:hypothetical protein [Emticicia fontis]
MFKLFLYSSESSDLSPTPHDELNESNIYEFIAHNGMLTVPMLESYLSGMSHFYRNVNSIINTTEDPDMLKEKLSTLIQEKSSFCEKMTEEIIDSSLPKTVEIKGFLNSHFKIS